MKLRLAKLIVGADDRVFQGHVSGRTWNGFQCPYFTKEQVEAFGEADTFTTTYDAEKDAFITRDASPDGEDRPFFATVEDGETVHYQYHGTSYEKRYTEQMMDDLCDEHPDRYYRDGGGTYFEVMSECCRAVDFDGVKYYPIGNGWSWSLVGDDPWDGDFSRGAWDAIKVLIAHFGRIEAGSDHSPIRQRLSAACGCCEDEAELRTLLADGLVALDEAGVSVSDTLREHIGIAAAGGNPWAV